MCDLAGQVVCCRIEECVLQWEDACDDPEDPDKLTHYVEPHYSLLRRDRLPVEASVRAVQRCAEPGEEPEHPYQPVAAEGDDAPTVLAKLMAAGPRLCLVEDSGSGIGGRPRLPAELARWKP